MSTVMIRWIWWITWRNNPIVAIDIWNVHEWLCFGVAQLLSICNPRCVVRPWSHALIFSEEDSAVQHIVGVRLMTLRCIWIYPKQQVGLSGMDLDYHLVGHCLSYSQPTHPPSPNQQLLWILILDGKVNDNRTPPDVISISMPPQSHMFKLIVICHTSKHSPNIIRMHLDRRPPKNI